MRTTRTRLTSGFAALAAVAGLAAGILTTTAPAASAQVLDTDHPIITATDLDFGENWVLGAPVNGGDLDWDLVNGVTTPRLDGYLYLKNRKCGQVWVDYFDANHTFLALRTSPTYCAPGNGKTQFFVNLSGYSSPLVTHVHVKVNRQNSNGTWTTMGTDIEDFD